MRFLLGLSFGIIIGAGGIIALLVSGSGDFFLASSPRMQALESELKQVKQEREFTVGQLREKLEEVAAKDQRMADSFERLKKRFERIEALAAQAKRRSKAAPTPRPPAPSTEQPR